MRQLSRRAAVGLELLVLPARSDREGVHGLTAAFSRREAPGEPVIRQTFLTPPKGMLVSQKVIYFIDS